MADNSMTMLTLRLCGQTVSIRGGDAAHPIFVNNSFQALLLQTRLFIPPNMGIVFDRCLLLTRQLRHQSLMQQPQVK